MYAEVDIKKESNQQIVKIKAKRTIFFKIVTLFLLACIIVFPTLLCILLFKRQLELKIDTLLLLVQQRF